MNKNVPKLRFKGFEDEWKEKKLSSICIINQGLQIAISDRYTEYKDGRYFYITNEFLKDNSEKKYYIENPVESVKCTEEDILMTRTGNTGKVVTNVSGAFHNNFFKINYDKEKINKNFLCEILTCFKTQKNILRLAGTSTIPDLNHSDFYSIRINLPSLEEQTKIANFLSNVDKIIEEQEGKVKDLELYKKGMMQKIFKQEIRFKDDNGQDYPKWEEKKLGVLGSTYTGLSGKTKEDFGFGKGRYITYMNVFKNIRTDIRMIDLVDIKENENQNTVLKGDLLFTTSSETPQEVGMVSVCDNDIKGLYLNSFCFGFRFNELSNVNSYFMASYLRSPEIRMKISILAQGSTRYNLSKTELMKIKLLIPCLAEQTKIDNLLSNIDKIIKEENKKLEDLRQWKKGLLQQMFV